MASIFKRGKNRGRRNRPWQIAYRDETGKRRVTSGCTDRTATEQIARKLETDAQLRRRGIIDSRTEKLADQGRKPLRDHLDDWKSCLLAKGRTRKHANLVHARASRLIELCGAERISFMTPSAIQGAIGVVRDDGASQQTANHYLRAIKAFSCWLWRDQRTSDNKLAHMQGCDITDRMERRALSNDETRRLIQVAECGLPIMGLSGANRAMLYRLALGTGFRANELRSLTPESFQLEEAPPTVTVEAAFSKHRRRDVQPIRADLARLLAPWLVGKPPGAPVIKVPQKTAKMLKQDLLAADIPHVDIAGRVADFHALRHTFGTSLVRAGVHPRTVQTLMRHSSITLTMDRYSHVVVEEAASAIEALPPIELPMLQQPELQPTGTHGA